MIVRLRRINPIQAGVVAGVLYALIGIVMALLYIFVFSVGRLANSPNPVPSAAGLLAIFVPFIYAALGFIGGAFSAWIYNVAAGWVGGVELQFDALTKELASP